MKKQKNILNLLAIGIVFLVLPFAIYWFGDFPRRSILKETISMLTILAFFTMLLQFYITRVNTKYLKSHKMSKVSKWHKALGYIFIPVLILHPLLIVLPRGLEGGISPIEALIEIIANFDNTNLLLGLLAWLCMIGIGITAFLRFRIGLSYKAWRILHGLLSIGFITLATIHVINMGRHSNNIMIGSILIIGVVGVGRLISLYITDSSLQNLRKNG